jgi:hypothetical protein
MSDASASVDAMIIEEASPIGLHSAERTVNAAAEESSSGESRGTASVVSIPAHEDLGAAHTIRATDDYTATQQVRLGDKEDADARLVATAEEVRFDGAISSTFGRDHSSEYATISRLPAGAPPQVDADPVLTGGNKGATPKRKRQDEETLSRRAASSIDARVSNELASHTSQTTFEVSSCAHWHSFMSASGSRERSRTGCAHLAMILSCVCMRV